MRKICYILFYQMVLVASNRQSPHASFPSYSYVAPTPPYVQSNEIPIRWEWETNNGYCGEASFVAAGLYFGQYCSQYTARALASPNVPQSEPSSQLLLGVNDATAATSMRLDFEQAIVHPAQGTNEFLIWVKKHVSLGHPVIIGLFNNESLIYGDDNPNAGDDAYDHIVSVRGVGSFSNPINDNTYHDSDRIYFSDNGLYGAPGNNPPFLYNYDFGQFKRTRDQANNPNSPPYSIISDPSASGIYGIAILGVKDTGSNTLRINITSSVNYEQPGILDKSNQPPVPIPITLAVTVSGLTPATAYNLYLYDDFTKVPTSNFNAHAADAKQVFHLTSSGTTYAMTHNIMSNETIVFRAVLASAP